MVLHTDASLLPRRRRAWASWNFHLEDQPAERTTVTYHMNRLQSLDADQEFCVTLNKNGTVDEESVISAREFSHPVFSHAALVGAAALARDQRGAPDALLRRLLGLRLPRGRRAERAERVCERFGAEL